MSSDNDDVKSTDIIESTNEDKNKLISVEDTSSGNKRIKVLTGQVEEVEISKDDFLKMQRDFNKSSQKSINGNKKRVKAVDPADIEGFLGPWGGYIDEVKGESQTVAPSEEEIHRFISQKAQIAPSTLVSDIKLGQERSIFHGKEERDYLGRTYMSTPSGVEGMRFNKEAGSFECFAPKKLLHTWSGHTKGVNAIRFIPKTGHLLLSAGQDQRIKLWDVYGDRSCLRTFYGHNKPVRDISFDHDGSHFASCAFDKTFKYWDTETGKCTFAKEYKSIPYCVKIHPDPSNSHILMVGTGDRRVLQYDLRSEELIQEYVRHHDVVNSITFFQYEGAWKFVTSSDDRTLRVWDYGITGNAKQIVDPDRHSMPYSALHPTQPFMAFQSLGNRIQTYALHDNLSPRTKRFIGHNTCGYACQIGFSPDGKFIFSGDGKGQLVIWNWEGSQIVRRIEAHSQVCIGAEWNPQEPSRLATCSWDGSIKYWE